MSTKTTVNNTNAIFHLVGALWAGVGGSNHTSSPVMTSRVVSPSTMSLISATAFSWAAEVCHATALAWLLKR